MGRVTLFLSVARVEISHENKLYLKTSSLKERIQMQKILRYNSRLDIYTVLDIR